MLIKRGSIYYLRWQIPSDLQCILNSTEFIKSTRTSRYDLALHISSGYISIINKIKQTRRIKMALLKTETEFGTGKFILNSDTCDDIIKYLWSMIPNKAYTNPQQMKQIIDFCKPSIEEILLLKKLQASYFDVEPSFNYYSDSDPNLETYNKQSTTASSNLDAYAEHLRSTLQIDYPEGQVWGKFTKACIDLLALEYSEVTNSAFKGTYPDFIQTTTATTDSLNSSEPSPVPPEVPVILEGMSTYIEGWVKDKVEAGDWRSDKDIGSRKSTINDIIEILGDLHPSQVTKANARYVRSQFIDYPANRNSNKLKNLSLDEIPDDVKKISEGTARQKLKAVSGFFNYLVAEDIIDSNPFQGVTIKKSQERHYASYTTKDLHELFNLPSEHITSLWQWFIPRVALFSGARLNEIAQLTCKDIIQNPDNEIWYMSINNEGEKYVKNNASVRRVPIHSMLIDNGFIDYVIGIKKKQLEGTIWPELPIETEQRQQKISKYWGNLKSKHGIPSEKTNAEGENKVFHSLRRTMFNQLNKEQVDLTSLRCIVGHDTALGVTGAYIDEVRSLEELNQAINKLNIEGINWKLPEGLAF